MNHNPIQSAIACTLSIYLLMNRHSREEEQLAHAALKLEFDQLTASGEHDQERLVLKGLTLLRQLDERKPAKRAFDRLSQTQIHVLSAELFDRREH